MDSKQSSPPRILIAGLGAVGTVVADALNQGGCHPWALSRRVEEDGVRRLHALDGTCRTLEPAARMASPGGGQDPFDLVILTVRGTGDADLAAALEPFIDERTIVLPLMNGGDYLVELKALLKTEHVLTGRIYTATERIGQGRYLVHQRGFMELSGTPAELDDRVMQFFSKTLLAGDLPVRHMESHQDVVWRKLAYNTPFSILEEINPGQAFNHILSSGSNHEFVIRMQAELRQIAATCDVDLDEELLERHLRYAHATPHYLDSYQGVPYQENEELRMLVEYPMGLARAAGLDTPVLDEALAELNRPCDETGPSAPERPKILPAEVPPIPGTLPELIDQALERHPEQMIRDVEGVMSYAELGALSREIAGLVEPGRVVGVLAETGRSFMAAMLGTLYGGATVMPLDPGHPAERIQGLLEQGEVDLLLHDHEAERVKALMKRIRSPRRVARIRDTDRTPGTGRRGGGQVLATSGSTGAPKLIHQDEAFLLHGAFRHITVVGIDSNDRIAAMNSPEVTGTSRDILMSLLSGAGISWRRLALHGPKGALSWMQEEKVTVWCTVASLARTVLEAGDPEVILTDLKALKITGEPMFSSDFDLFVRRTRPQARLHVGLTSTEVLVATENILSHGDQPERLLSIGWAVPPLRVGVVDEDARELPRRTPGRLAYVGGHLEPDESGWGYVSEDIAMMDSSGRMTYLGRNDGMLKIAGNRIDIGDIEYNAGMITDVRACAAFPFDREDRTLLGLAVELKEDVDPDRMSRTIREELARVLPRSVLPHRILILDSIPRLSTAKPDRKALSAMIREMQTSEASDGNERLDAAQTEFLNLIRERGSMPSLGFDDSFFDAGGDSISLLRIISDIEERYDANIPFSILELEPTPRMLFQRANRS